MESSEFKTNLSELSKIPQKEFEQHFRDWMERDDVARSLQAKLRMDLITNFNKTSLGKQILAQTTTTTTGAYGGPTQRLTLSPLVLALNTLVAEFLYAENCHFSLSVFCTEVPFRNTLPDFESSRRFRFTEPEIADIWKAVSGPAQCDRDLHDQVSKEYAQQANVSLLLLILKHLLEARQRNTVTRSTSTSFCQMEPEHKPDAEPKPETEPKSKSEQEKAKNPEEQATRPPDVKSEVYNTSFRYLNKYLIVLMKKVQDMAEEFERLRRQDPAPRARVQKSMGRRKYENLNRSLERMTENLKQMSLSKRKSRQVSAIVEAIDAMSKQFAKCASNFESVSRGYGTTTTVGVQSSARSRVEKETSTEPPERTYSQWVHEMRTSKNGQKFLDRVEASLYKALNKQKQQSEKEGELKLQHQKELLKMRYKQKLIKHLSRCASGEESAESRKINENIERQLQNFEAKHYEVLHSVQEAQQAVLRGAANEGSEKSKELPEFEDTENGGQTTRALREIPAKEIQPKDLPQAKSRQPLLKDAINTQRQIQQIVQSIAEQGRNVDHIVNDAKLRLQELEQESNQLEQSFCDYMERQRRQKEATREAAAKVWSQYAMEKSRIECKSQAGKHSIRARRTEASTKSNRNKEEDSEDDDVEKLYQQLVGGLNLGTNREETKERLPEEGIPPSSGRGSRGRSRSSSSDSLEFKNAILEAKRKLFNQKDKNAITPLTWGKEGRRERDMRDSGNAKIQLNVPPESRVCQHQQQFPSNAHRKFCILNDTVPVSYHDAGPIAVGAALNSTLSEINLQDCTLGHGEIELSSSSNSSHSSFGSGSRSAVRDPEKLRRRLSTLENQQQQQQRSSTGIATTTTTITTTRDEQMRSLDTGRNVSVLVGHDDDDDNCAEDNVEIAVKGCKNNAQPTEKKHMHGPAASTLTKTKTTATRGTRGKTTANATLQEADTKPKAMPTSLVLQQSLAKMNQLFGEQQKAKATTTTTTISTRARTTSMAVDIGAVGNLKTAVETPTVTMVQKSLGHVTDGCNDNVAVDDPRAASVVAPVFGARVGANEIENRNVNETQTVGEMTVAPNQTAATMTTTASTITRTTVAEQLLAFAASETKEEDSCIEQGCGAQAAGVSHGDEQEQQQLHEWNYLHQPQQQQQHQQQQQQQMRQMSHQLITFVADQLSESTSGSSGGNSHNNNDDNNIKNNNNINEDDYDDGSFEGLEVGEVVDAVNVDVAVSAAAAGAGFQTTVDAAVTLNTSDGESSSQLQLSIGGGRGTENSSSSDFWE